MRIVGKIPKSLISYCAKLPFVVEIRNEGGSWLDNNKGRDYWVELGDGYSWCGCGSVHESSVSDCISALKNVTPDPA